MRAAVLRQPGGPLHLEELALAAPAPDEVHVRVRATAICASDLSFLDGHWSTDLPVVLGHETVGDVVATGAEVAHVGPGDRVVVSLVRSCGACEACERRESVRCTALAGRPGPLRTVAGEPVAQGMEVGGFAEEVVVHGSQVVAVPADVVKDVVIDCAAKGVLGLIVISSGFAETGDDLPLEAAVLLGCGVVTGFGAVANRAEVAPGSSVVVVGCGGVGIHSVQAARVAGASPILAVDPDPAKRASAVELGATVALDPLDGDLSVAVAEATDGAMADTVVVTVGSVPATEGAFDLLAAGGTVVLVGMTAEGTRVALDATTLAARNQRILGSKMGSTTLAVDIPRIVARYQAGEVALDSLVSASFPLADIDAAIAAARRADTTRVVVTMGGEAAEEGAAP